jgi:UDP-N-acetyl-D-mannosaminuronate dehydrogenase
VLGLGEVGLPLLELSERHHAAIGVDVEGIDAARARSVDVMHVCYPFEIDDFVGETARYIDAVRPRLTVINSTVAVGTTREVYRRTGAPIAHSPVRGKHTRMLEELLRYDKFIGGIDERAGELAAEHFRSLGMSTVVKPDPETTELAKLTETTYFGLLIAWAQEVERYCEQLGLSYDDVVSFYDEISFFPPPKYFPGVIGGHCVMPNMEILSRIGKSMILEAITESNRAKIELETRRAARQSVYDKAPEQGSPIAGV